MNQEDQINLLNKQVKIRIAPSKIHGVGVFALRNIAKGQKLNADNLPKVFTLSPTNLKKLFPEIREFILERWPLILSGSKFVYPTERILSFMNHSDNENYNPFTDTLIKPVKKGEEITENYRNIANWDKIYTWLK